MERISKGESFCQQTQVPLAPARVSAYYLNTGKAGMLQKICNMSKFGKANGPTLAKNFGFQRYVWSFL